MGGRKSNQSDLMTEHLDIAEVDTDQSAPQADFNWDSNGLVLLELIGDGLDI